MTVDVRNRQRRRVNTKQLKQIAERIFTGNSLSIVLVNDREMAELNERYHHVAGTTDVLTFDYGDGQAEIIISVDQAHSALDLKWFLVHGILHLQGFDDRTPAQRRRMRFAERRLLNRITRPRI